MTTKKSGVVERVPRELVELGTNMKDNFGFKSKTESYRYICKIVSPIPNMFKINGLQKNKKAQLFDIVIFSIAIIVMLISYAICNYLTTGIKTAIDSTETDASIISNVDEMVAGHEAWQDFSFGLFFFMLLIVILAFQFFIAANLLFIMIYVVLFIVAGIFMIAFHNIIQQLLISFASALNSTSAPITYFICTKFFYIIVVFYLLCFALLFMKRPAQSQDAGY